MNRTEQLKALFDVLVAVHAGRGNMYPQVSAQFHVDWFVSTNKNDKHFDQLLQYEIEDCSRALVAA